jgi:hypothetical protein
MSKAKTELYGVVPSHQVDDARGPAFLFLGSPFPLARVVAGSEGAPRVWQCRAGFFSFI